MVLFKKIEFTRQKKAAVLKWNNDFQVGRSRHLKGQSHGDFSIFFVTIWINLYQSTLLIHELFLDHQGDY